LIFAMPEIPSHHDENPTPHASNSLWKFLIAFAVLAAIVVAVALPQYFQSAPNTAQNTTHNAAAPDNGSTPEPPPAPTPKPKGTTFVLFVPNDNAMLSQQKLTDTNIPGDAPYKVKAKRALELLFARLEFLPPRTKLLSAPTKDKNGIVRVDLSKEFLDLNSKHETPVMLTLDAMARTLGALESPDGKNLKSAKVQFLIDGKTVSTLSEFSLDEPWTASETVPDTPDPRDAI
jgi:hypothetical protein